MNNILINDWNSTNGSFLTLYSIDRKISFTFSKETLQIASSARSVICHEAEAVWDKLLSITNDISWQVLSRKHRIAKIKNLLTRNGFKFVNKNKVEALNLLL